MALENPHSITYLNRAAVTDGDGKFAFAPLAPGEYRVELRDSASDLTTESQPTPLLEKHPVPAVFIPHKVTLAIGREPAPIEFRPPATVVIDGQVKFARERREPPSDRNPFESRKPKISGEVNGQVYTATVTINTDGKFVAKVPRGMSNVQVRFADRYGPQFRIGKDKPLIEPADINLGTVNEDIRDLEIVYP